MNLPEESFAYNYHLRVYDLLVKILSWFDFYKIFSSHPSSYFPSIENTIHHVHRTIPNLLHLETKNERKQTK